MDLKLEVVLVPVSDVDRAKDFYARLGWRLDADFVKGDDFRVVQLTPPGSACSIIFGTGISREGGLIDLGVEQSIVRKSGAWYTYEGDQLGQGKENSRNFLRDNPDLANEIEKKIKEKLGVGPRVDAEAAPAAGAGANGSANGAPAGTPGANGSGTGAPAGRAAAGRAAAGRTAGTSTPGVGGGA